MSDEHALTFERLHDALICTGDLVIWGARSGGPGGSWDTGTAFFGIMQGFIEWLLHELVEAGQGRDELNRLMATAEAQGQRSLEHGAHFLKIHWDNLVSDCGWLHKQLDEQANACPAS